MDQDSSSRPASEAARIVPDRDGAGLRRVVVRDLAGLTAHRAAWDRLAWDAPQSIPTLFPDWVEAFLRHRLVPGERWFCAFAYRNESLVGALPVIVTPHRILGGRGVSLRTPYDAATTPSGDIPLAPAHAVEALRALVSTLREQAPGHLGLVLNRVRRSSPLWDALAGGVAGYVAVRGHAHVHHAIALAEGFDHYFARLGNLRRNLKRYRKRLDERGPVSLTIEAAARLDEPVFDEFLRLEASGWKGRAGSAIANDPTQVAFYAELFRNFAGSGRLEWHRLTLGERLVAAGMGLRCRDALMLPRIAFDEALADCTPGNLLTEAVTRDAFSRPHLREISHMSDAAWHRNWHMDEDSYQDLHLVRPALLPALFRMAPLLLDLADAAARRRVPPDLKARYRALRSRWRRDAG